MTPGRTAAAGALLSLLLTGCIPHLPEEAYSSGRILLEPRSGASGSGAPEVELQYLGVGGWRMETPHTVLLTGPLLTRYGMVEVGLGATLEPDSSAILGALQAWEVGPLDRTAAILVGHGHYDHLLDTPWMAARLAPRARILGNRTTRLQLLALAGGVGLDSSRVEDVTEQAATPTEPGEWIRISRDVRVLPVAGDHAPHLAGHILYDGVREVPLPEPPGPVTEWLDGKSLAFLVDVLRDDGSVALRIYYQDAIPRAPAGTLPPEVLAEAPVDLALLVPATFAEVEWHPEVLVENLRPRQVLVQHWEDFFRGALEPPEPVAFTILPHFLTRLERVMGCGEGCIRVPDPGTRFVYPLGTGAGGPPMGPRVSR